jgi:hypothetical protein
MPWSVGPTNPKYRTAEHRHLRAQYVRQIRAGYELRCTAKVCLLGTPITNPNGNAPDGLHLGHEDNGIDYAGPQHNVCNKTDGARRGNARSRGDVRRWDL